jgi:adenylate kinase family enzyme
MPDTNIGQRIVIIGTTGMGKTTLACRLAALLTYPHIELDALHWGPNWQPAPLDCFRTRVAKTLAGDRWVTDGNYSKVRDIVWRRADTVVWLDYSRAVALLRLTRRTLRRMLTQEVLWNGNRESWRTALFSRDSILRWALKTHGRHRREYPCLFQQPEYDHLLVIQLRSPRMTRHWLESYAT